MTPPTPDQKLESSSAVANPRARFSVFFSEQDDEWVATIDRYSHLSALEDTPSGALDSLLTLLIGEHLPY